MSRHFLVKHLPIFQVTGNTKFMPSDLKTKFKSLSQALQGLHKDLLMLQAKTLESESGRRLSPYDLLDAAMNNLSFAWLRRMSELIVTIDTIVDETPNLSAKEAHQIADSVLTLLEKPQGSIETEFWRNYANYLNSNPDIIMRHSKVKEILSELRPSV